jgi:hypothetical protein
MSMSYLRVNYPLNSLIMEVKPPRPEQGTGFLTAYYH